IKKVVPSTGETTVFVYDAGAKLIAEYSTVVAPVENAKVAYLTADHLGSPRINTDATGNVIARHDYMPFGEEIYTAQRAHGLGYTADSVRQKFTGYERDDEADLDFAQARYHNRNLGRFFSPDRYFLLDGSIHNDDSDAPNITNVRFLVQPQYFNRYTYTINNPLKLIDVDGRHPGAAAVVLVLARQAAIGAAIGAVAGAAIEAGKQIYYNGEIK
ncbi:MAG: RHS repeat domain-containing protein, partial [Pyrinomonadaceae bacterium]